jgi:hypothetical protein
MSFKFIRWFALFFLINLAADLLLENDVWHVATRFPSIAGQFWWWDIGTTVVLFVAIGYAMRRQRKRGDEAKNDRAHVAAGQPPGRPWSLIAAMAIILIVDIVLFQITSNDVWRLSTLHPWLKSLNRWWGLVTMPLLLIYALRRERVRARRA